MNDEKKSTKAKVSDGIKQGIGVLSAFKDALEETITEAKERGDLSPERAKEVMKNALHKAQEAAGEARERLDFVSQKEYDALARRVQVLEERLREEEREAGEAGAGAEEEGS